MEKASIDLIKAVERDKDFLVTLRKLTMTEHLEKQGIFLSDEEHMSRVNIHFENALIITKSDNRIGLLKYLETNDTIEILQIQVLPEYQGIGIGKYVLHQWIEKAKNVNKRLTLKVLKDNPARRLYEQLGFCVVGEEAEELVMSLS